MKGKLAQIPETLDDCILLWQMGYIVVIHDGKVEKVLKEKGEEKWTH